MPRRRRQPVKVPGAMHRGPTDGRVNNKGNGGVKPGRRIAINDQQRLAVYHYLGNGFDKKAAMLAAGYSEKSAASYQAMFDKPTVRAEIEKFLRRREVTADRVIEEIAKIAFTRVGDLLEMADDGSYYLDLGKMNENDRAALTDLAVEEDVSKNGKTRVRKSKVKFASKTHALEMLGKVFGIFTEKVDHHHTVDIADRLRQGRERNANRAKIIEHEPQ